MWTVPSSALYSISRYTLTTFNSPKITLFFSEIIYSLLLVITLLVMICTSIEGTILGLIAMIVVCKTIIVITCRLWLQKSSLFKKHPIKFKIYAWIRRSIPLLLYDLAARSKFNDYHDSRRTF